MKKILLGLCLIMIAMGFAMHANEKNEGKSLVVILLGPPGSGKGTQAKRLSQQLKVPHISTGDLFRENMSQGTLLGKKAKSFIEAGKLVPDQVVLDMLFERVSKPDSQGGYLLDGFPRTIPQAKALEQHLANNVKLVVLNLDVKDELIIKRIAGRQSCQQCGNVHNQHFSAPSEAGKCDKCKGALVQRTDDSPEVVKERLRVYHEQTKPLVHYYQEKGILYTVDGEQPPDIVFNSLIKAFN